VVVDGEFEGTIQVEADVLVGTDGRVNGDIEGRSIRVAGSVTGNLKGIERVEILGSGKLQGDVAAPRVILAEGAFFRGNVEMTGQKEPKADKAAADKAAADKAGADKAAPATKGAGQ
jgi:cytoskeletal protein CcmA (bactofilin family)